MGEKSFVQFELGDTAAVLGLSAVLVAAWVVWVGLSTAGLGEDLTAVEATLGVWVVQ